MIMWAGLKDGKLTKAVCSSEAKEQAEPGAEHKAPSAEGVSEQAHTGSSGDGTASG